MDLRHPPRRPDLVPRSVRYAVRDAVGGWGGLSVARIDDLFRMEGFEPDCEHQATSSGSRRSTAERFDVAIDFTSPAAVERYLRVVGRILDDIDNDDARAKHEALTRELERSEMERDTRGRLRLRRSLNLPLTVPIESDIRLQLERLERLDQEPEEMIGAAKDLIESVAKHVFDALGEPIPTGDDVVGLSKAALAKLKLTPDAIAPTNKGAETIVRVLGSLGQVAGGIEALRNLYGVGHGRGRRTAGLQRRHAEFAARSAATYAAFVLDTIYDDAAPWRATKS